MAYRYQKELDLLEATRGELNITDTQYNELTDAIKAQGGSAEGGDEPQAFIPGYESVATFDIDATRHELVWIIKSLNKSYNSFDAGLPVEITLGKMLDGNDYDLNRMLAGCYALSESELNGPSFFQTDDSYFKFENGVITTVTIPNQVPAEAGMTYGAVICGKMTLPKAEVSDADLEHFKKNFKIKIG